MEKQVDSPDESAYLSELNIVVVQLLLHDLLQYS